MGRKEFYDRKQVTRRLRTHFRKVIRKLPGIAEELKLTPTARAKVRKKLAAEAENIVTTLIDTFEV